MFQHFRGICYFDCRHVNCAVTAFLFHGFKWFLEILLIFWEIVRVSARYNYRDEDKFRFYIVFILDIREIYERRILTVMSRAQFNCL